jgi:transposase-like protein
MSQVTKVVPFSQASSRDILSEVCKEGAQQMLALALKAEVAEFIERFESLRDASGQRLVVRNGHMPERDIASGIGPIRVRQPRVEDRRPEGERFTSALLPPYLRRTKNVDELLPWLYLKGISTSDFPEAMSALLGPDAKGLSPNTIQRLKDVWRAEYADWNARDLTGKRYVYMWVDAVYFNVRLADDRACILVILGATADGRKELVAIHDGMRESELSWLEALNDLKRRGLKNGPELAIGDGALGFWAALPKAFPKCRVQRCWVHKTANVLNKLPQSAHSAAKKMLHEIWMADTRKKADKAFEAFVNTYRAKHPKAVECLEKDRDELLAFYDFPAEHWSHIRTTNPIESMFATVRLRTGKTKGCGTRQATLMMVFKLAQSAGNGWRKLNGSELLADVIQSVRFVDGIKEIAA